MLAHVQTIVPLEALEACIWEPFIVVAPADSFVFKKIHDGGNVLGNQDEAITVQAKSIAAGRGNVIRLARSADSVHVGKKQALLDQGLTVCYKTKF